MKTNANFQLITRSQACTHTHTHYIVCTSTTVQCVHLRYVAFIDSYGQSLYISVITEFRRIAHYILFSIILARDMLTVDVDLCLHTKLYTYTLLLDRRKLIQKQK